jgi:hypothetical protein
MGFMPSIIEEHSELALVGSIEVEAVEGEGGESVFNRILYLPQESGNEFELGLDFSRTQEQEAADDFDESYEGPETILDALTNNFMNSCVGCQPFYPKSALRRKAPGVRAVPSEQPIADRMVSFSSLEIRECKSLPTRTAVVLHNIHTNSMQESHLFLSLSLCIPTLLFVVNMTLGNHPSATSGPPVMLDSVSSLTTIDLDEYEDNRGPRRTRRKLKLSYKERKAYLTKECGYTTLEVQKAWAEALQIRKQRQETLNRGLLLMAFDDVYESACRKMNRVTSVLRLQ